MLPFVLLQVSSLVVVFVILGIVQSGSAQSIKPSPSSSIPLLQISFAQILKLYVQCRDDDQGAKNMINLRTLNMNGHWDRLVGFIAMSA
jgi:hypothetical protein